MFGRWATLVLAAVALLSAGCDDSDKEKVGADAGLDAGSKGPVLGGKLGAAVAAAASASAKPAASAAADGPPESGVFAAGKADAIVARGGSSKIELFSEGSDPKVSLVPKIDGGAETKTQVTVAVRMGPQSALPTIEFDVAIKVDKPKDGDKKDGDKKDDAAGDGRVPMVAKVTKAALAPVQPGQLPKELAAEIAKLKGSAVRWKVARNDGGVGDWQTQLAKDADPGLETGLAALADALAAMSVPAPSKPVGVGAYWMVTDRGSSAGVDVLRYRVLKVEKIEKDAVTLSIELRQYAGDDKVTAAGMPKGADYRVEALESQGKGRAELATGALVARDAEISQRLGARLKSGQAQQRGGMVQIEMNARLGVDGDE